MVVKKFYLIGQGQSSARHFDIGTPKSLEELRAAITSQYNILSPKKLSLYCQDTELQSVEDVLDSDPIGITVDGRSVREPQAPQGLPILGNHLELYPDHVGNHQRLFTRYGCVIKTNNMGRITYLTNNPEIASVVLKDGEYFTKAPSSPNHPLYGIRDETALFLCDTDAPAWKEAHKFVPPSMSPKAVRHYTPLLQKSVDSSFNVLDQIDARGEAFNVYRFTAKLASEVICQLVLGVTLHHFDSVDAPLHRIMVLLQRYLTLNRRVQTKGAWYSYLPFGDPAQLQRTRKELYALIEQAVSDCKRSGSADLPIHTAALHASCLVDYLARATDESGNKLPRAYLLSNTLALVGAGFVTSSALLSWLVYALVAYPDTQTRLLQELVDAGADADRAWTYDELQRLSYLDAFVKETQRLHGPSFQPARNARRDVVLPGGWAVPAGAVVIPSLPHMQRHPAHWRDPDRFDADRWARPDEAAARHRSAFVPFAAGARGCVGFNVALQEVKVALAELVYRYHFVDACEEAIEYDPEFIVLRPMNFYARAIRRTSWPEPSPVSGDS